MHGDVLRHFPLQRLVDETHHRQVAGKFRITQEAVDTRAQRKNRFEARQAFQEAVRWTEADKIVDLLRRVVILAVQETVESLMAKQRLAQRIPSRRQQEQDVGLALLSRHCLRQ